jgi:hypothetical protein
MKNSLSCRLDIKKRSDGYSRIATQLQKGSINRGESFEGWIRAAGALKKPKSSRYHHSNFCLLHTILITVF